ncbi:MAG: hypothetical protein JNK65_10135, partial [Deltaproteobacteria bacterium]|nr:hypothetical protein [Deltaproteobacteria bacterium]
MSTPSLKAIIESILFASETPLNAGELLKVILRVDEEKESEMKSEAESSEVPLETSQETPVEERTISVEDQLLQAQSKEESRLARSDIQQA